MVILPKDTRTAAEVEQANRARYVEHVRGLLASYKVPAAKDADPEAPRPNPSVLIVAATDEEALSFVASLRCVTELEYVGLHTAATHGNLTGRGYDLVVYLPGWRGPKPKYPAADQWKQAIVQTRFRDFSRKWEVYL